MLPKFPKLRSGVGAAASVMSNSVHPINIVRNKHPNRLNKHKFQGVILVEIDVKVVRQGANAILVFVFSHSNFPEHQFHATKRYIHVTKEVEEGRLFILAEDVIPAVSDGDIGPLAVDENNCTDVAEAKYAPILLLGRTLNLCL